MYNTVKYYFGHFFNVKTPVLLLQEKIDDRFFKNEAAVSFFLVLL